MLQSGEIQKVGSERSLRVDVRVIATTHKDLRAQVASGGFREDLLYRLNVVPIHVPALRERVRDIPLLAHHFARTASERNNLREKLIDEEVLAALQTYAWPGNVRELQNVMERMMKLSGEKITTEDLPDTLIASTEASRGPSALREFRDRAEREFVLRALRKNHGNISRTAAELGIARTYLHRRLVALSITKKNWLG